MANNQRIGWPPSQINAEHSHKASEAASIGDLAYYDSVNHCVRSASNFTVVSETVDSQGFAAVFAGVFASQQLATDATGRNARLIIDQIWNFPCASSTFSSGDLVGPDYSAGLLNQSVKKVTDNLRAIGRVIKEYTSATTTVKVRLFSRLLSAGNLPVTQAGGSLTADDITGSDASLGIAGKAGSSGAGGILALVGGAGDSNAAGGAVSLVGGAGGATNAAGGANTITGGAGAGSGAGGALTMAGGVGGGAGGNASLAGGAGTGTGAAGTLTLVAGAGGATNVTGGAASLTGGAGGGTGSGGALALAGGASGAGGATGTGGAISVTGGASVATNGTGGAASLVGGAGVVSGSGGATVITGGATGATGVGGAVTITGGVGAAGATAGSVAIDPGAATGGTAGTVTIGGTNACNVIIGSSSFFKPGQSSISTEGFLWYDASAHKLKVRVAAATETITSA